MAGGPQGQAVPGGGGMTLTMLLVGVGIFAAGMVAAAIAGMALFYSCWCE